LTADRIRVVATPNGGGFGGKSDVFGHEVVVCKASMLLGKPVRIALTREEVYHCHRGRHPVAMRLSTGVDADGRIASVDLQTVLDGGAYGSYGVASTYYTGALQTVTYRVPAYRWRGLRAFTNKAPCGPKRGHGTVQPRFAQEVQLDEIAASLGKDPAELRLAMIEASGGVTANWLRLPTVGLAECIRQVVARSGFATRRGHGRGGRGLGLACSSYLSGAGLPIHWSKLPHSAVQLRIDRSGLVVAYCGATEIGQGSDDVLAACVAEELGLEPKAIRLVTGDTDLTPVDLGSYSSRVTLMMGNAAVSAARKAAAALREAAAAKLGVDPAIIVLRAGKLWAGDSSMPFRQAAHLAEEQRGALAFTGSYRAPTPAARWKGGGVGPSPTYSYTAAVVEVDVDEATGFVRPERVWIAHDLGRPINKTLAEGQVIGSVYMGLGEALLEEQEHRGNRPSGTPGFIVRAPSLLDNKSLLHPDMPPVDVVLCGEPDPEGPYGAKEVGQGPLAPVVPALVNAVWDAVSVRSHRVPLTPDLLLRALDDKARGKPAIVPADPLPAVPWPPPLRVRTPWEGGDGTADEMGDYEPGRGHRTDV
jgi:4-hydroxybenzoyl-CoA reductase subunit alpha